MRKKTFNLLVLILLVLAGSTNSYAKGKNKSNMNMNYSNAPAKVWQDGLVSGNGTIGIMVMGDPHDERLVLNHEFLYEFGGVADLEPPFVAAAMPQVKQLIKEGKYTEAEGHFNKAAQAKGHKRTIWTDPYHPAGELIIDQSFDGEVSDYIRTTNYENGEISVNWKAGKVDYSRKFFVSRTDDVFAGKIEASKAGKINSRFAIKQNIKLDEIYNNDTSAGFDIDVMNANPFLKDKLKAPFVNPEEYSVENGWITFKVSYQVYDRGYEAVLSVKNNGGKLSYDDQYVTVEGANSVEVYGTIITIEPYSTTNTDYLKEQFASIDTYDNLLAKHTAVHSEMYDRVKLHLDKTGYKDGSNEELIKNQLEIETINPYFLEKIFNMGHYTLISSSGQNPPNLMGIWNGEWRPLWSGDFTLDANVNLQISGANLLNLPEAINSYMNLLERISPDWEINAFKLYGCRGYYAGFRTSGRRGLCTHFMPFPGWTWTSGAQWLISPCFEYYLCSGDKEFLHKRLFPMMEKVALFYEDFLDTYDENGKYLFAPSYSPENNANLLNGTRENTTANSTVDIAAAKDALFNILYVCEREGINHPKIELWKSMIEKMPPYLINEDGALKEWAREDLADNYNHRHISHLYPVLHGEEMLPETNPVMFKAANVAAEKRGIGDGSAHGLSHTALISTRLKRADLVSQKLLFLMKEDYFYNSLFTSHNPKRRIFNSDALHCIPAVIAEMLVYSRPGVIEFIPALPADFANGTIEGVACRTEAKVNSLEWNQNKKVVIAQVSSSKDQNLDIQLRRSILSVKVDGKKVDFTGDKVSLAFKKGEVKNIEMSWK